MDGTVLEGYFVGCTVLFVPKIKSFASAISWPSRTVILFFLLLLVGAASFFLRWNNPSFLIPKTKTATDNLECHANWTSTATCSTSKTKTPTPPPSNQTLKPSPACPAYFRWIHEDLHPWKTTGISQEAVQSAAKLANFRLVVINGQAYVEHYHGAFQTRDVFTLWGILQLLNRYPGRVPDFDLMFNCDDTPVVRSADYPTPPAPPLFRYCKDDTTLDIVFPDWSFWEWPEINIKPWVTLMPEMAEGNKRVKWVDREPYAYWKGNSHVAPSREELMKCNVSKDGDWNARLYNNDWDKEIKVGFKGTNLADQCLNRYKIYIEGRSWSVSGKYILACDSPTLLMRTGFHDFFTRGLMPENTTGLSEMLWIVRNAGLSSLLLTGATPTNKRHKLLGRREVGLFKKK